MLKEKISGIIDTVRNMNGVVACTLVSRDGILLGKYSESEFNEAWFAAMSATLLASAESAAVIIKIQSPEMVTIESNDGTLVIMGAGEKLLLTALVRPDVDFNFVSEGLKELAIEIGGSF